MPQRQALEVALAEAEARLQLAVTALAKDGPDKGAAAEKLAKARADCREARAALTRLDRAEP